MRLAIPVLLIGFAMQPAGAAAALPAGFVTELFDNGFRVSILPEPTNPMVATQVWYHVGSANEDRGSRGLAHLFEHLMFGATRSRTDEDYWDLHHRHGGDNNAYTTFDETVYISRIPPEQHLDVLRHEADRMVELVVTAERLANEIEIVTEELRLATENDPMNRVLVRATRALLGEHPYALWPTGTKEDLAAATVESCKAFYESFYGPGNAHLVIVGPVDPAQTLADVRSLFGAIPSRGAPPREVPALTDWSFPEELQLTEDLPPVELAITGFLLPPPADADYPAIQLLSQLLAWSSVDPFRDELVSRRGKAIEAGTQLLLARRGGTLAFYSASLPYRRKRTAFRLIDRAVQTLSDFEWLTEESLAGAKRSLRRYELRRVYFAASRAGSIGRARWWLDDEARAFDRAARIDAVSLEEVRRAFRKYVAEPRPIRLYLKPERVPIAIRLFGWLYPLVS